MLYNPKDKNSILNYAKQIENKCLQDVVNCPIDLINKSNKGNLGNLIESLFFGFANNNRSEADFKSAGVELKVTPLKKLKNGELRVKERLVIENINYMTIVNEEWNTNTLLNKLKCILLMFYLHEVNKTVFELIFKLVSLWSPSDEDLKIIEKDWNLIVNKVKAGKAEEISEGDTRYLGACTKGASSETVQIQPFSDIKAKKRAFSLKNSYMQTVFNQLLNKVSSKVLSTSGEFENKVISKFETFYNKNVNDLVNIFNVRSNRIAKHFLHNVMKDIIKNMFGDDLENFDEFKKSGIEVKTILLKPNGIPKESMSFPAIDYVNIVKQDWETSDIKEKFENQKHLWVIFQAKKNYVKQTDLDLTDIELKKVMFWNMPERDLDNYVYILWNDTVNKIKKGDYTHFLKSTENPVCHIRPHGKNSKDLMITPQGNYEKKMCFWLNAKYISQEIIRNTTD